MPAGGRHNKRSCLIILPGQGRQERGGRGGIKPGVKQLVPLRCREARQPVWGHDCRRRHGREREHTSVRSAGVGRHLCKAATAVSLAASINSASQLTRQQRLCQVLECGGGVEQGPQQGGRLLPRACRCRRRCRQRAAARLQLLALRLGDGMLLLGLVFCADQQGCGLRELRQHALQFSAGGQGSAQGQGIALNERAQLLVPIHPRAIQLGRQEPLQVHCRPAPLAPVH